MSRPAIIPVRDCGPLGSLILGILALALGVAGAWFVNWDGIYGLRLQVDLLGPDPPLVNGIPFLFSLGMLSIVAVMALFLCWVVKIGSFDRSMLALLAFSFNADVVPGLFQVSLFGLVFMLVSRGIRLGDIPIHFSALVIPILLIIVSYCTSMLNMLNPLGVTISMPFHVSYMLMVLILPCILRTRRQFEIFIYYLIVAALIAVAVEFAQMVLSAVTGNSMTFAEVKNNRVSTPFGIFPRLTGLMYHPNHQANLMGSEAVLALWVATRPKRLISTGKRVFFAIAYLLMVFATFLTWSRSGWLCLGIASLMVPVVRWPRFSPIYITFLAFLGGLAFVSGLAQEVYEIIRNFNASSADFRWHINDIGIQAFLWRPGIGIGVGQATDFFNPYQLQVHNAYLQILAEMGLFGASAFLLLFSMVFGRLLHVALKGRMEMDREWAWALLLAAIVTVIQSSFDMFLWIKFLWAVIAMMECVVQISRHQHGLEEPEDLLIIRSPARRQHPSLSPA